MATRNRRRSLPSPLHQRRSLLPRHPPCRRSPHRPAGPESERERLLPSLYQRSLSVSSQGRDVCCPPLDEETTIEMLKGVSVSALVVITALNVFTATTVAPIAPEFAQSILFAVPYTFVPFGLCGIGFSMGASKTKGLLGYASLIVLAEFIYAIALGAFCTIITSFVNPFRIIFVAEVLVIALISAWGWIFAYPKWYSCTIRRIFCDHCFGKAARRVGAARRGAEPRAETAREAERQAEVAGEAERREAERRAEESECEVDPMLLHRRGLVTVGSDFIDLEAGPSDPGATVEASDGAASKQL